jgi:RecB family exonuclease
VIAPRRTSLVRVPDLAAFQRAIADRSAGSVSDARGACIVIVPTEAAAAHLTRTIDEARLKPGTTTVTLPDVRTRAGWYDRMHASLPAPPRRLNDLEREVVLSGSIREAIAFGVRPPFKVRPGLVPQILSFYDVLRRLNRGLDTFERLMTDDLAPAVDADRGAARLLVQTTFLTAVFRAYERRVAESGVLDEHTLRQRLLMSGPSEPVPSGSPFDRLRANVEGLGPSDRADRSIPLRHVIVTIGDRLCDPPGLWPADFDLLTRLAGIDRIDVIATEQVLRAGFQQRVEDLLPGIEEVRVDDGVPSSPLLVASAGQSGALHHVHRDREEELLESARRIKARGRGGAPLNRVAIVVRRPLPNVYLARSVFEEAGLSIQTMEALPLAAEPFAAALNLVFECVISRFTRTALVALMRSPHFRFTDGEGPLDLAATASFSRALADAGYLGDLTHLARLAGESRPARIALGIARELEPLRSRDRGSAFIDRLLGFVAASEPPPDPGDALADRTARARAAMLGGMASLRDGYLRHDDPVLRFEDLAATIKRRIEQETFALPADPAGVHLIDAQDAAYGVFDEVHLVGLVEGEWPERNRPSIFYPGSLLAPLGWPAERERVHAVRAAFRDLLQLARERVLVSTFTLEGDDIVEPSTLLEQLDAFRHLPERVARDPAPVEPVAGLKACATGDGDDALDQHGDVRHGDADAWLALRQTRTSAADGRFHGEAGVQAPRPHAVAAIDLYLDCPFKYFATHVLKLQEDPEDEETMSQKTRGRFIHEVFRTFFDRWQTQGEGAVTVDTLDRARALFREVAEAALASLGPAEANLERTRLLGSSVATGLGERVLRMEAERPIPIVERLLEFSLNGEFDVTDGERQRRLRLAGTADRIDLLADGSLRLIDYKLGRGPHAGRAIQLPVYGLMATERLTGHAGRSWVAAEAGYLAFGRQDFAPIGETRTDLAREMAEGQARLLSAIDGIERGSFPPQPAEPFFCGTCPYSSVCRKDYVETDA